MTNNSSKLAELARLIRYYIIRSTTAAGSGHPTSSLSATELMTTLMFGGFFRFKLPDPSYHNNDRLIFSKGHASPLFYSLWAAAGALSEEQLLAMRKFDSPLEGHPTMRFPYTEVATGSLGQGLSIGVGMALAAKYIDELPYRTFVLLGDSEVAEGSVWEAAEIAKYYRLNNLIAILDVNRLGQRGETMYGHDLLEYEKRFFSFGWQAIVINGHDIEEISRAYEQALATKNAPTIVIAKTIKGKGIPFLEDQGGWHGKALKEDEAERALAGFGEITKDMKGDIAEPQEATPMFPPAEAFRRIEGIAVYKKDTPIATRKAYGNALVRIFPEFPNMVVLDAEVSNSTFSDIFKEKHPERFFEMFIAEQNMVGAALGFSRRGKIPFVSTFAAFFTRAFDQIRMSQYSNANIKFCGSHAGVSIGEDGASQMGLEDIAMFRTLLGSAVLYPSDAVSCDKLVEEAAKREGIVYIRTTRKDTSILYDKNEKFPIGGSKILRKSRKDDVTIVAAGITLHEALVAHDDLKAEGVSARVIDLYSIKPIDQKTLKEAASETKVIITVEDHFAEGGIGEAVKSALEGASSRVYSLAVYKMPKSGKPTELLNYENISARSIVQKVKELV